MSNPKEAPEKIWPKEYNFNIEYIRADISKDSLKAVDLMIIDRDAFHDENEVLKEKLKIAVEALEIVKEDYNYQWITDDTIRIMEKALKTIKGDQDEV